MFVKPRAVSPMACLNVQSDYYKGKPHRFSAHLPDYLGWIQLVLGKSSKSASVYLCIVLEFCVHIWNII